MPLPFEFDYKNPDYRAVFEHRLDRLERIRREPDSLPLLKLYYKDHPAQFITDWGLTYDPRNPERGLPSTVPFLLFPRQEEWVEWFLERWQRQEDGITVKTRDMGMSWLTVSLACTLCLFRSELSVGVGSRKEEYVDVLGDPDSLFEKARMFLSGLPKEFRGSWDKRKHSSYMKLAFPETGGIITGEAGDGIGRGGRQSFYIVDESAFLIRPKLVDASLSATTNCRQDISTPNGLGNPFAERVHEGKVPVFRFHWRDDPRKGEDWYAEQVAKRDKVTIAQEVDMDFAASVEGVVIPSSWVQAAIGAHLKLGIEPTGRRDGALDVADEGKDKNAFAGRHGVLLNYLESWSGKGDDIFGTVQKAFSICDDHDYERFDYDADGLGAGVRGDSRIINTQRKDSGRAMIGVEPFRGSGEVWKPDQDNIVKKRKNKDFFANAKSQGWWWLRILFQNTYRAVVEGMNYDPDRIICIDPQLPELLRLTTELSQPTSSLNSIGKITIDKMPDGMASPNLADAVMILYHPGRRTLATWKQLGQAA